MILVISHVDDVHAMAVIQELQQLEEPVLLFDLATFPLRTTMEIDFFADGVAPSRQLSLDGTRLDLGDVGVVWWRRPLPFGLPEVMRSAEDHSFAYNECYAAIAGLWKILDAWWINDPVREEVAARKLFQLRVARECGLRIPRTRVTNSPEAALAFADETGATTVYKAFAATEHSWRETRLLRPEERDLIHHVQTAPVIFQEYIDGSYDLRITIVGDEIFAAKIASQEMDYKIDFRMHIDNVPITEIELPEDVAQGLKALMTTLGLSYGAIDMRLTPEGEFVFLEINPTGQWLFVERATGQPIARAMAELMQAHDDRRPGSGAS